MGHLDDMADLVSAVCSVLFSISGFSGSSDSKVYQYSIHICSCMLISVVTNVKSLAGSVSVKFSSELFSGAHWLNYAKPFSES